ITIKTNVNINCSEYLPFVEETKIVKLDYEASLKLTENLPRLDGAAAAFPLYSAFVNATYPNTVELDSNGAFRYNNTVGGYKLLAEKEIDIFFGAYPSEEQIQKVRIEMPNAFTPNSGDRNSIFKPAPIELKEFRMDIYNSNGVMIFTTNNIEEGWDGTYKGNPQPMAVYVYIVKFTNKNGVTAIQKGELMLIR
ncbi:MAG: gliding motility-associated C-terminal domain-containing protein, partial [Bacteroidales bacterium]|nr:gliding motility-associated C-terminal domain-containing protein [Bacteroidales bacterium]